MPMTPSLKAFVVTMALVKACNAKKRALNLLAIVKSRMPMAMKHFAKDIAAIEDLDANVTNTIESDEAAAAKSVEDDAEEAL